MKFGVVNFQQPDIYVGKKIFIYLRINWFKYVNEKNDSIINYLNTNNLQKTQKKLSGIIIIYVKSLYNVTVDAHNKELNIIILLLIN